MKGNTKYDIFISYRRSSYDTANLIATRLKAAGYSVFFDLESLRAGKFNEQLYNVIENCKDFISVLPPNALDRCVNDDDWVRLEICHAMKHNKNIIPVMLNGFTWPETMPSGMEEIRNYHALTAGTVEYFDMAMEHLQRKYLTSKPHVATKILAKRTGVIALSLAMTVAVLYAVFMILSKDVCRTYAVKLVNNTNAIHMLAEENVSMKDDWNTFATEMKYENKNYRKQSLQEDMLSRIDLAEKNAKTTCKIDSSEIIISNYHSLLLSLNGISSQEIAISPALSAMIYSDYLDLLETLRNAVMDPNTINIRYGTVLIDVFVHTINSYYLGVLAELSAFPESALKTYNQMSPYWHHYPTEYKLGESIKYYEEKINREAALADEKMSRFDSFLEVQDAEIEDMERKLDEMVSDMDSKLAQMEKDIYNEFKQKNTILETDDQWYQWEKIAHWGSYLMLQISNEKENEEQGIDYKSSVTPEMVCSDIIAQLSQYQKYHPESKYYVASMKALYTEILNGRLDYGGVLVFAIQDNAEHPIFRIGDIIVEYDGKKINNLQEFTTAYKANNEGSLKILRLDDNVLKEVSIPQIKDVDVVGFVDLKE